MGIGIFIHIHQLPIKIAFIRIKYAENYYIIGVNVVGLAKFPQVLEVEVSTTERIGI